MQELSADDFRTNQEPESVQEAVADNAEDVEEEEMQEWERGGSPPRSIEEMAEHIRRTPPQMRTEVLSPAGLAEYWKKSPPTCQSHIEQPSVQHLPPPLATLQAITFKGTLSCCLCGDYGHIGTDCRKTMHSCNTFRKCTNCQETGHYSIL